MVQRPERLERLVDRELGDCCDADVEARIEALEAFAAEVPQPVDRDVDALKALGNDTRYTVARLIRAADRELCVCEITPVVDVSDSAISHALSALHDAGLVRRRKEGTWRYYATTERADALLDALDGTRGDGR
jgi:DNA-binding transcriptional ArsR family regulator